MRAANGCLYFYDLASKITFLLRIRARGIASESVLPFSLCGLVMRFHLELTSCLHRSVLPAAVLQVATKLQVCG
jgi:hypothetical protein